MAFFKRIEVWFLLLLSVAGVAWVLWSERSRELFEKQEQPRETSDQETTGRQPSKFEITERRLSREGDHVVLSLRVKRVTNAVGGKNGERENLKITDSNTRLATDEGQSVERFFLPYDPEPVLDAHPGAEVTLRYWVPLAQTTAPLWLEIEGERLAVRSSDPWEPPGDFPEGVEIAVRGTNWER
jgi:hypothetical protein